MNSPELSATPETAYDLTEEERERVYAALEAILAARGEVVDPAANARYITPEGKPYTPAAYHEASVSREESESFSLPYDVVFVTDQNPDEVSGEKPIPGLLTLGTSSLTNRSMPTRDGRSTTSGFGTEEKYVIFGQEAGLGIVIEREDREAELQDGEAPEKVLATEGENGEQLELSEIPTHVTDAPPLTRQEILGITAMLEALNQR
jgi:hypothetical protein